MQHSQKMVDLGKEGEDGLARELRNLPLGGSIKFLGSAISVRRADGGRRFTIGVPPKVRKPLSIPISSLKSIQTAVPVLIKAHQDVLEQDGAPGK